MTKLRLARQLYIFNPSVWNIGIYIPSNTFSLFSTEGAIICRLFTSVRVEYVVGRAKRARRYLVMFMEVRDILYICVRLFLIRMCALSVLRIKFKS